jgi:agmatinase
MTDGPAVRRTEVPSGREQPRFAGLETFGRYPRLADVAAEHLPVDWAVFGAPFDNGVTFRNGARFGPSAIRRESRYLKSYHLEHDLWLTEAMSLADAGDAPVEPYSPERNAACVSSWAASLDGGGAGSETRLMMLGGDHSNTLAGLRAAYERHGSPEGGLALIHFDSHLDTVDAVWGERYGHASPFIRAIEEGVLDPRRTLSVGIKGPLNTPDDLAFAREHGVTVVTFEETRRDPFAAIDAFVSRVGDAPAYLTFDIDAVDPVFAPGTGTPSVGGFTSAEALGMIRRLASGGVVPDIVGADVVEVLPDRDVGGNTALLAAHLVFEIMCVDGVRRRSGSRGGGI